MKLFKYISIIVAVFALAACSKADLVTYDPSKDSSGALAQISGCALSEDGEDITITFQAAAFSVSAPVTYTLLMDLSVNNFSDPQKLDAKIGDGTITVSQSKLNKAIINKGIEPNQDAQVDFCLMAYLTTDKGAAIDQTAMASNIVTATFTTYEKVIGEMPVVDVPGDYQGWAPADYPKLFNYSYDEVHYRGVVDFQCKKADGSAANGFKITGGGTWSSDTGNWGSADQSEEAETNVVNLINGDNSQNIKCYGAHRYYLFEFNQNALTLTKFRAFDQVGVIGLNGNWDSDIVMTYNMFLGRFWADVDATDKTEFKFRLDAAWDSNWGGDLEALSPGGSNIPLEAGQYRIYFYMNDETIYAEVDASMYGKEEPGAEPVDPDKPQIWSLIGTLNGTGWDTDFDLANLGGDTWAVRSVNVSDTDEFKIRADHDWSVSLGGPVANSQSTIDPSNPYDVYKPELGTIFNAGDKNIQIGKAGLYDITLNYSAEGSTILIEEHKAVYSLIGEINGDTWSKDIVMKQDGDVWTSPVVNITGGFKIRYDYSWDDDNTFGIEEGTVIEIGKAFNVVQPGQNMTVPEAGDYKVVFNTSTREVTIIAVAFPETMYMIGQDFGAWDWNSNAVVEMVPVNGQEGQFWTVRYFTAGNGFKYCAKRAWDGDFWGLGTNDGYTESGGNCVVDKDGFYLVHIDVKNDFVHIEPARVYGMGDCWGGWDARNPAALFEADGNTMKATLLNDGEIRIYVESEKANSDWWTREFIFFDGKIAYRGNGGDQERVRGSKDQVLTLDFNAGTADLK